MLHAAALTRLRPKAPGRVASVARQYGTSVRKRDPRTLVTSGLFAALILEALAFGHITEDYLTGDPIVRWDVHFATWLHEHASSSLVNVFEVVTYAGNALVLGVVILTAAALLLRRGRLNDAALLVAAFGGAVVVNGLLKLLFHRRRPELSFVHLDTYSFPSGHAAAAAATFTAGAWLLALRHRDTRARVLIVLAAALLIVIVGFSRLYLGAHYLSDVLAGFSFGLGWATLCLIGYTLLGERDLRKVVFGGRRAG